MYYLGIGLHKDESHVAVLDDDAEVVEEIRVTNANLDVVADPTQTKAIGYAEVKNDRLGEVARATSR